MQTDERALDMIERRESGQTLAQIGTAHGVSRERVRQILTEWMDHEQREGVKRLRHERGAAYRRAQVARWRKNPHALAWRFWSHVSDPDKNGCRLWEGTRLPSGYGRWPSQARRMCAGLGLPYSEYAHRLAWMLINGPLPKGPSRGSGSVNVLHRCDVPACCEPGHLFLGSPKDNAADREQKGRRKPGNVSEGQRRRWASYSPERRAEVIRAAAEGRRQA